MKFITSNIFRSVCSLLVGMLLLFNAQAMPAIIVRLIGLLFLLPGIIGVSTYIFSLFVRNTLLRQSFPLMSIGSLLFGIYLEAYPNIFVIYLVALIGFLLLLAGVNQLLSMFQGRGVSPFSWLLMLMPIMLIVSGGYCITHTGEAAGTLFQILGATCIYYGLSDLFLTLRAKHYYKAYEREQRKAEEAARKAREAEYIDFEVINANDKES